MIKQMEIDTPESPEDLLKLSQEDLFSIIINYVEKIKNMSQNKTGRSSVPIETNVNLSNLEINFEENLNKLNFESLGIQIDINFNIKSSYSRYSDQMNLDEAFIADSKREHPSKQITFVNELKAKFEEIESKTEEKYNDLFKEYTKLKDKLNDKVSINSAQKEEYINLESENRKLNSELKIFEEKYNLLFQKYSLSLTQNLETPTDSEHKKNMNLNWNLINFDSIKILRKIQAENLLWYLIKINNSFHWVEEGEIPHNLKGPVSAKYSKSLISSNSLLGMNEGKILINYIINKEQQKDLIVNDFENYISQVKKVIENYKATIFNLREELIKNQMKLSREKNTPLIKKENDENLISKSIVNDSPKNKIDNPFKSMVVEGAQSECNMSIDDNKINKDILNENIALKEKVIEYENTLRLNGEQVN